MILRLGKRLLSAEVLGLVLVVVVLRIFTYGVSSSLPGTETGYLFWVSLAAAWIGYGLSRRSLSGLVAPWVILALGVAGVWVAGARLLQPLLGLFASLTDLLPGLLPALRDQVPIDTGAVREAWGLIAQASSTLALRWRTWLVGADKNVSVNDPLIRSMIWTLVMWSLAAWTGWFTARRSAVLAVLPGILLLAAVLSYSEYRVETLWLMVFLMLLLMGVWNYKNHTTQWQRRRVDYSDSILYDNTAAVLLLAVSIGGLAFITPSISWRDLRDLVRERNSNEAAEMLGIRPETVPAANAFVQKPALPREHLLTEGFAQSRELVMTIRTGELPPVANPSFAADAPRHYWRSTVYDQYMGAGWITGAAFPQHYRANTPLVPGLLDGYRLLHMDVKLQQPEGKLFWSGILYSADIPIRADWRIRPQNDLFADQTALLRPDLFVAATGADAYRAQAYIPVVTVQDLRQASRDYPEELRERYLKLPGDLPERVHALAGEITRGTDNPYDRAKAIESYLRANYPYDLDVPAPPEGQDVADYFLFDLQRGYCDYYATAMVVLARASGLPARFVSGYAPGTYDAPSAQYIVRELNAHSWPEIYFPGIGWIEFEPTASQPLIERRERPPDGPAPEAENTAAEKLLFRLTRTGILYWAAPVVLVVLLAILYFTVLEQLWILRLAPARAVAFLYRRYYRLGRPLAGPPARAETASEFTTKLLRRLDEDRDPLRSTGQVKADARQLTDLYLLSLFSNRSIDRQDARQAFRVWRHLRGELLFARLRDRLPRGDKRRMRRVEHA